MSRRIIGEVFLLLYHQFGELSYSSLFTLIVENIYMTALFHKERGLSLYK